MQLNFIKFQNQGNDFIFVEDGKSAQELNNSQIEAICSRHFGVGSDGFIWIEKLTKQRIRYHFRNPDGSVANFCGNGALCLLDHLLLADEELEIECENGEIFSGYKSSDGEISLVLPGLKGIGKIELDGLIENEGLYLEAGTPHVVFAQESPCPIDTALSEQISNDARFPKGVNINWVSRIDEQTFKLHTFERGVGAETLACASGALASAYFCYLHWGSKNTLKFITAGGELIVDLEESGRKLKLRSRPKFVFSGNYNFEQA